MAKIMKLMSGITLLMTVCFFLLYHFTKMRLFFPLTITSGTMAYHFSIRLIIGGLLNAKMKNKADYTKKWYQVSNLEQKLYQKLKVKKWKNKMPTYDKDVFDTTKHSWDEIIQAMCQSELVHEINIVFSLLSIVASVWFDSFVVFLVTAILGAMFDLMFVMMQRYNRSRILKMKSRITKI